MDPEAFRTTGVRKRRLEFQYIATHLLVKYATKLQNCIKFSTVSLIKTTFLQHIFLFKPVASVRRNLNELFNPGSDLKEERKNTHKVAKK